MKIKIVTIDFQISPRAKNAIRWVLMPLALLVGSVSICRANWDVGWVQSGHAIPADKMLDTFNDLNARLTALQQGALDKTPPGTIIAFAGDSCPNNYIPANGTPLLKAGIYAELYDAIQDKWGTADASHFIVPNLTNRYLRGAGVPTDTHGGEAVGVGEFQDEEIQPHQHPAGTLNGAPAAVSGSIGGSSDGTHTHGDNGHAHLETGDPTFNGYGPNNGPGQSSVYALSTGGPSGSMNQSTIAGYAQINSSGSGHVHSFSLTAAAQEISGATGQPTIGGTETRPKAYGVNYCIKY